MKNNNLTRAWAIVGKMYDKPKAAPKQEKKVKPVRSKKP